jgi:hypothetical protein
LIGNLRNLKRLSLDISQGEYKEALLEMLKQIGGNLGYLSIFHSSNVDILSLASLCPNLVVLHVWSDARTSLTSVDCMKQLRKICPRLKVYDGSEKCSDDIRCEFGLSVFSRVIGHDNFCVNEFGDDSDDEDWDEYYSQNLSSQNY